MKVALVHDYLNQVGGGERVLDELVNMFPDAPIYTLLYDEQKTGGRYRGKVRGTSFLDFQFARNHHRLFIPLMPLAARRMNLGSEYDLIISDSAGFGKGISYDRAKTKHLCYVHTPLRYAWETDTYFGHTLRSQLFSFFFAPAFAYVRNFDYWAGQQPDKLLANSQYIAAKVKEYYNRDAAVVYPSVDTSKFYFSSVIASEPVGERGNPGLNNQVMDRHGAAAPCDDKRGDYFLAAGRLLHYKRFDLIIDAFKKNGLPLKIVGTGPMALSLRAQAAQASNIQFLGFVDDAALRALYSGAAAFIMANEEDFGLVMAEAQSCGAPVIAYGKGGALEIVESHQTGVFFHEQTAESLLDALDQFNRITFDRATIAKRAQRFSVENFRKGIQEAIAELR